MEINTTLDPVQLATTQRQVDSYNAQLKARGVNTDRDMGQDKYLKLLVTQLRYQDPQNPLQNHEFAAQMAQFSALEQMTKMNTSLEKVLTSSQIGETYQMLGREVSWLNTDSKEVQRGIVKSIILSDNKPLLRVGNLDLDPDQVLGIHSRSSD